MGSFRADSKEKTKQIKNNFTVITVTERQWYVAIVMLNLKRQKVDPEIKSSRHSHSRIAETSGGLIEKQEGFLPIKEVPDFRYISY
jgi:hypothetical protein